MPNPARYADDVVEGIRRLLTKSGVVLPPPGAAGRAIPKVQLAIDPAIAARAAPTYGSLDDAGRALDAGIPAAPDMSLGTPLWDQLDKGARSYDNVLTGRTANLRNQPFAKTAQTAIQDANASAARMRTAMEEAAKRGEVMQDVGMMGAGLAAAGAAAAGAYALRGAPKTTPAPTPPAPPPPADPLFEEKKPITNTGGTADLAEQSRPTPQVATSDDPRQQAQELIAQLNAGHRAGTITPAQDQQMRTEIDRLLALSNQRRNAMTPQQAQGSSDPHIQAQALIAQLNQMRQQAGGEIPQAQQIMAEVRRLQALGDQQRNAAQTR